MQIVRDPERAAAVLHPSRLRMLEHLAEPGSASTVARRMGLTRQQVNYHLHELEKNGYVELVEERRVGNCLERVLRATAESFVISPEALGALSAGRAATQDRFSAAYLVSAAARVIRDLAILGLRASRASKRLATMTAETKIRFRSAEERSAFAEELAGALAKLTAKYNDDSAPGGRAFHILAGAWPVISKQEQDGKDSVRID